MIALAEVAECDVEVLHGLRTDIALQHLLLAYPDPTQSDVDRTRAWIARRQTQGLLRAVRTLEGATAGFVQLSAIHERGRFAYLGIALNAGTRGRGLGGLALTAIEELARITLGLRKLLLEVRADNHAALAMYRAHGWREIGTMQAHYDDGDRLHHVVAMEKALV